MSEIFIGRDVEEAIAAGLAALGLSRDQVEVQVLDEGTRGMLGIGGRAAQVQLTPIPQPDPSPAEPPSPPSPPESQEAIEIARKVVSELLTRMGFDVQVQVTIPEEDDEEEEQPLLLNVVGDGLETLLSRRGETLADFQRIVRLIVNKRMGRRVNLLVDVDGYRRRRERQLQGLAERIAERVAEAGHKIALEPMLPYERRIVHLTLQNRDDVYTESEGRGRDRRVVIFPK